MILSHDLLLVFRVINQSCKNVSGLVSILHEKDEFTKSMKHIISKSVLEKKSLDWDLSHIQIKIIIELSLRAEKYDRILINKNNYSHASGYEVTSYGFDLHIPSEQWRWASFHVLIGHLYILSWKIFKIFVHFWTGLFVFC